MVDAANPQQPNPFSDERRKLREAMLAIRKAQHPDTLTPA